MSLITPLCDHLGLDFFFSQLQIGAEKSTSLTGLGKLRTHLGQVLTEAFATLYIMICLNICLHHLT